MSRCCYWSCAEHKFRRAADTTLLTTGVTVLACSGRHFYYSVYNPAQTSSEHQSTLLYAAVLHQSQLGSQQTSAQELGPVVRNVDANMIGIHNTMMIRSSKLALRFCLHHKHARARKPIAMTCLQSQIGASPAAPSFPFASSNTCWSATPS